MSERKRKAVGSDSTNEGIEIPKDKVEKFLQTIIYKM